LHYFDRRLGSYPIVHDCPTQLWKCVGFHAAVKQIDCLRGGDDRLDEGVRGEQAFLDIAQCAVVCSRPLDRAAQ